MGQVACRRPRPTHRERPGRHRDDPPALANEVKNMRNHGNLKKILVKPSTGGGPTATIEKAVDPVDACRKESCINGQALAPENPVAPVDDLPNQSQLASPLRPVERALNRYSFL